MNINKGHNEIEVVVNSCLSVLQTLSYNENSSNPYPGLRIAKMDLKEPYLRFINTELLVIAVMRLYIKYALCTKSNYGKFTISFSMKLVTGVITFTLSNSIVFREDGNDLPLPSVLTQIEKLVKQKGDEYNDIEIISIFIRIYQAGVKPEGETLPDDHIALSICSAYKSMHDNHDFQSFRIKRIGESKRNYPKFITEVKGSLKDKQPFIVADTETLLINQIHVPYAVGLLVVKPDDVLDRSSASKIETYYSEDHLFLEDSFEKRSQKMMRDFINRILVIHKLNKEVKTVYFHNFSRFDGIILLKHLVSYLHSEYTFKPLIRNSRLYEIAIYRGKRRILSFRDSLHLLPGSLVSLSRNLCPELGSKKEIEYEQVNVSNLNSNRKELEDYLKQDILLLGGVMLKAQEIYWSKCNVDILSKLTLSSLAMHIFRMNYYDSKEFPIYIPNRNEDTFIRRGYYGGHAEVYKPIGENLFYYDVNSLYPYIMKSRKMPSGPPVWNGHLYERDLETMYGFIEAYIECPTSLKRPFLPYRCEKTKTLIFPTGKFVGVYYSEELKFARSLGYKIIPLKGYLFENLKNSPFTDFVTSTFSKRQEAKITGNDAMSYIYKTLMNSLYGRFGINPQCTITEVCDEVRRDFLLKKKAFLFDEKLSSSFHIVNYKNNTEDTPDEGWEAPRISAIQQAAVITAEARILMYPFISRDDCYYTDTDSVVLGGPLPEDEVSSTELGKFKLEYYLQKGIFLAPKGYCLWDVNGKTVLKQKGLANKLVDSKWYEDQYKNLSQFQLKEVDSYFKIDWHQLCIIYQKINISLGVPLSNKRKPIHDENGDWVSTEPLDVTNMAKYEKRMLEYKVQHLEKENELKDQEVSELKKRLLEKDSQLKDIESNNVSEFEPMELSDMDISDRETETTYDEYIELLHSPEGKEKREYINTLRDKAKILTPKLEWDQVTVPVKIRKKPIVTRPNKYKNNWKKYQSDPTMPKHKVKQMKPNKKRNKRKHKKNHPKSDPP